MSMNNFQKPQGQLYIQDWIEDKAKYEARLIRALLANIWAASWENQQCGFRTGPTQTDLYSHREELEA